MPSIPALLHRAPRYDFEGAAARRRNRRRSLVAVVAFVLSLSAVGGAVVAWAVELGLGGILGLHVARLVG